MIFDNEVSFDNLGYFEEKKITTIITCQIRYEITGLQGIIL